MSPSSVGTNTTKVMNNMSVNDWSSVARKDTLKWEDELSAIGKYSPNNTLVAQTVGEGGASEGFGLSSGRPTIKEVADHVGEVEAIVADEAPNLSEAELLYLYGAAVSLKNKVDETDAKSIVFFARDADPLLDAFETLVLGQDEYLSKIKRVTINLNLMTSDASIKDYLSGKGIEPGDSTILVDTGFGGMHFRNVMKALVDAGERGQPPLQPAHVIFPIHPLLISSTETPTWQRDFYMVREPGKVMGFIEDVRFPEISLPENIQSRITGLASGRELVTRLEGLPKWETKSETWNQDGTPKLGSGSDSTRQKALAWQNEIYQFVSSQQAQAGPQNGSARATAEAADSASIGNNTVSLQNDQSPQSVLRPDGSTSGTSFSTTPFGTIDPALNPNGLIDSSRGTQSGVDGNGGRGNAPTAVAAPGDENPFSNNIPEAGAILPQIPNVIVPGGWQMPAPGELLNGVFIPDTAPAPEDATSQSSAGEGPSISYTPNGEAGGVTIGGQLGSPGEAEKANTEMEQLLGKGSRQGVRPDLFPTPIDNRIPGFGEGVPPADANSNDTSWGLPDEPITLPESEGFPEKDPVLDNILNPNGVGRPQFTFPPIKEGSRIPEVPAEAQAALTKALPELQGIRYAQFSQLSAADQQQVIPRTLAYQQLAPNDKTNISLIEYLDSGKTSEPQRQQLSQLNAAQTVHQAQLNTVEARTGLDSSTLGLINTRIKGLQANTAQINQQTQSIQQSNAQRISTLATQAQADPMSVAFIKPEAPQGTSESRPEINAPVSQDSAPIPRFMVVRTENGPKLIENLANGQSQLHAYPLSADTPITRQESNGAWSGVPDVGQIGSRLFLDLLFTNGALKMLNNGNPVQAPGGATQQPPVNGTPQAPTGIPQPAF